MGWGGGESQTVGSVPLPPDPTLHLCFSVFTAQVQMMESGHGRAAGRGVTIFTHRQWLACLSSETRNFIVSRAQTCQENTSLNCLFFLLSSIGPPGSYD